MLAEALVAAAILATALVSLAQLFAIAVATNVSAQDVTVATTLASQKVEELVASPIGTLAAMTPADSEIVERAGARYVVRWSVAPLPSSDGATLTIQVFAGRAGDRRGVSIAAAKTGTAP